LGIGGAIMRDHGKVFGSEFLPTPRKKILIYASGATILNHIEDLCFGKLGDRGQHIIIIEILEVGSMFFAHTCLYMLNALLLWMILLEITDHILCCKHYYISFLNI
ncbi:hypothetical protein ACJX0J_010991, partial [Zea mays]